MTSEIKLQKWQLVSLIFGFLLIIIGLVMIILWQRGLVQLKWLQCPDYNVPYA